jgi:hypothetical protein
MCVCVYVCMCVYMYIYINIYIWIHTYIIGYFHWVEVGSLSIISSRSHSFRVSGFFWVLSVMLPKSHPWFRNGIVSHQWAYQPNFHPISSVLYRIFTLKAASIWYIYIRTGIYIYNYIHITIYVVICDTDVKWCMHKTYIILHRWHLWPQAFPAHAKPRRGLQGGDEGRSFLRHFSTSILDMLSESDMGHGFTKQENFCGLSSPRGVYRKPGCWFQELESKCWSIHMDKYPSSWPDLQFLSMTAIPSRQAASNLGNA